jgi:predicted amidophosphoribosyltransferase
MVSNEEISRRLALKRRGLNPDEELKKERGNICPNCGTANLENAKFCIGCGSGLNKASTPKMNEVKSNSIVCPGCGSENRPGSKFCIGCGNSLATDKHEENEKVPDSVICPECQSENKLESKFCIKCGSNLKETSNESIEDDVSDIEMNEEEFQLDIKNGTSPDNEIADAQEMHLDAESTNPLDKTVENNAEISSDIENISEEEVDDHPESDAKTSVLDEIKKAKELLDMGAISEEEYEKIKSKYLEQLN